MQPADDHRRHTFGLAARKVGRRGDLVGDRNPARTELVADPVLRAPQVEHRLDPGDADRHALWEMLVRRDIDAFISQDWSMVEDDFVASSFFGMHAHFLSNADAWRLQFPRLEVYRDEWLRQAKETAATKFAEPLREALFRVTNMRDIDVDGHRAVTVFSRVLNRTPSAPWMW